MPLTANFRIVSDFITQTDSFSRENAVIKAINKVRGLNPTQDSVVLGNIPEGMWPVIGPYRNNSGPSAFNVSRPPQFIWDSINIIPGSIRYFATAFPQAFISEHVMSVLTFSDDAHRLFVEGRDLAGNLISSLTPEGGLQGGSMDPDSGSTNRPYNWQNIWYWSTDDIDPAAIYVISYEVVNYNSVGPTNPAGLAFTADFYSEIQG